MPAYTEEEIEELIREAAENGKPDSVLFYNRMLENNRKRSSADG